MPYLDSEEKFYDYKTGDVTDEVVFDTTTTGTSYYNQFINSPKYMIDKKNLVGEIKWMTPIEYFEGCAKIFNSTVDKQIRQTAADKATFDKLTQVLTHYKRKFPIGHLDFAELSQEGRHRMYAAGELVGWDVKQPVLVIDWHDRELQKRMEEEKHRRELEWKVESAIKDALRYTFDNIDDLRSQIQYEINKKLGVSYDEDDVEFEFTTDDDTGEFVVTLDQIEVRFKYDDVMFRERDEELIADEDEEDLDAWLQKYLGTAKLEALERHDSLNPKLWDGLSLRPKVRTALLEIVDKYLDDSEVLSNSDVIDIEIVGSNANYNYTPNSDIDVHIVVNMEGISSDPVLAQIACNAEKALFNNAYNITVKGIDVELYVEDVKSGANSNGVYSVMHNKWLKEPHKVDIPDMSTNDLYKDCLSSWEDETNSALKSTDVQTVQQCLNNIYNLRRISLMADGEFGVGNLVFKEIRNQGLLDKLKERIRILHSRKLSLENLK